MRLPGRLLSSLVKRIDKNRHLLLLHRRQDSLCEERFELWLLLLPAALASSEGGAFLRVELPDRRANARILVKQLVQQRSKHPERHALRVRPAGAEEEVQMYATLRATLF